MCADCDPLQADGYSHIGPLTTPSCQTAGLISHLPGFSSLSAKQQNRLIHVVSLYLGWESETSGTKMTALSHSCSSFLSRSSVSDANAHSSVNRENRLCFIRHTRTLPCHNPLILPGACAWAPTWRQTFQTHTDTRQRLNNSSATLTQRLYLTRQYTSPAAPLHLRTNRSLFSFISPLHQDTNTFSQVVPTFRDRCFPLPVDVSASDTSDLAYHAKTL